jgi:hypothetical protein
MAMARTPARKRRGQRGSILDALFAQLAETRRRGADPDIDRIAAIYNRINRADAPDKEKLKKKDEELAYKIYEWWTSGEALKKAVTDFVDDLLYVLMQIEDILWELKGGEGEYPKPKQRPKKK